MRALSAYKKYAYYIYKYGSAAKLKNYLLNQKEFKARTIQMKSLPYKITVDPGNVCNLRCPGCHTGILHKGRIKPQFLTLENYKIILKNFEKHALSIALYNWGEPFMNPEMFSIIEHTHSKRVGSTIHSNFNIFDEQMAENAVKSGLTHIYLSIDGSTQDAYSQYRVKGNIDNVIENIKIMVETRKRLKSHFPILTWKFLVFEHNKHEIEDARKKAMQLGLDSFEHFMAVPKLTDIYDLAEQNRNNSDFKPGESDCQSLWSSIYVNPNGEVLPCSLAFRPEESFGNLLENSLQEVWNNRNYISARRMFVDPTFEDVPLPCKGCSYSIGKSCHKIVNNKNHLKLEIEE
ncbi:MAG: radical SAM protein [Bacteroidetes bacterium]|nr:radical SAM protein [Bacteroidota bacterium]